MLGNGATVEVAGGARSFTDPGDNAWKACAGPREAEANYTTGADYQAFASDQRARGEGYVECMVVAGFAIPGHKGVSGDVEVDPTTSGFQAGSIRCSDGVGLLRRNDDGTGVAPAP